MEFFSRDAGTARRNALAESLDGLAYYVPPELRPWLGIANELNPVVSMERAGTNALTVADPSRSGWERVQALGDMTGNMAGAVAPMVAASRGAVPAANAVEDALMGWSTAAGVPDFMADEFGGVGFRAYHGSPHDFDRFSLDKIGTGEGAQAYGHGLYFADSEDVALSYREALKGKAVNHTEEAARLRAAGVPEDGIRYLQSSMNSSIDADTVLRDWSNWTGTRVTPEIRSAVFDAYLSRPRGRMYEVQINADPADFLDWDKPLSEQPEIAKRLGYSFRTDDEIHAEAEKLFADFGQYPDMPPQAKARLEELQNELDRRVPNLTGEQFYTGRRDNDYLHSVLSGNKFSPEQSEALRSQGIPGIRYLDAGSRGAADVNELRGTVSMWDRAVRKTPNDPYAVKMLDDAKAQLAEAERALSRNYVVFDDKLIEIIRKYGWAAAAPIFAASGLTVEEAQAQYEGQM